MDIATLSFIAISLMVYTLSMMFFRAGLLMKYHNRNLPNHIQIIVSILKWTMIGAVIGAVVIAFVAQ